MLAGHESPVGFAIDAASKPGDDGLPFSGTSASRSWSWWISSGAQDRNIVAGKGAADHCPGLPSASGDPDLPDQVGDLLVERAIFGAAEHHQDVGQNE
jgi:hypothetical protein